MAPLLGGDEPAGIDVLLAAARRGSSSSLGTALESVREYLLLIANQELSDELHQKVGASDLVQDSFIEAQRDLGQFQGTNSGEWRAWLRRILLNNLEDQARRYQQREKRQISRELPLSSGHWERQTVLIVKGAPPVLSCVSGKNPRCCERPLNACRSRINRCCSCVIGTTDPLPRSVN